jgi:hypothetical protein
MRWVDRDTGFMPTEGPQIAVGVTKRPEATQKTTTSRQRSKLTEVSQEGKKGSEK